MTRACASRVTGIQERLAELGDYGLLDLRWMNGAPFLHLAGKPNHRGPWGAAILDTFERVGQIAPGSYGLLGYGRTAENELTEAPNIVVTKPGSVLTTRVREVCQRCNNRWMSRLEMSAQPVLERLWQPTFAFGQTTVTNDEASIVATWATKTAWIRERVSDALITATPSMRRHLDGSRAAARVHARLDRAP